MTEKCFVPAKILLNAGIIRGKEQINADELKQLADELEKFNKKNPVKIVFE